MKTHGCLKSSLQFTQLSLSVSCSLCTSVHTSSYYKWWLRFAAASFKDSWWSLGAAVYSMAPHWMQMEPQWHQICHRAKWEYKIRDLRSSSDWFDWFDSWHRLSYVCMCVWVVWCLFEDWSWCSCCVLLSSHQSCVPDCLPQYVGSLDVPRPNSRMEIVAAMRRIRVRWKHDLDHTHTLIQSSRQKLSLQ